MNAGPPAAPTEARSPRRSWRSQARLQARLTIIEAARRREQVEARQHANMKAMVAGTPTALQLALANDGPATAWEVWATELPVCSDDPPLFHGLDELEQASATLRPGIGSLSRS